jgi:hypothetical protein
VQVPTALVALAAAWKDPVFLVLLLPLVVFTHVYNHARFGVSYPGWPSFAKVAQPMITPRKPVALTVEPALRDVNAPRAHSMTSEAE